MTVTPLMRIDTVPCRLCGATHATEHHKAIGSVCKTCWGSFTRSLRDKKKQNENEFNRWFSRQIILSVRRLQKYGTLVRCQAATLLPGAANRLYHYHIGGPQCAKWATTKKNGRFVCTRHARAANLVFVGTNEHSSYSVLQGALTDLAKADKTFREMLFGVAADLNAANRD